MAAADESQWVLGTDGGKRLSFVYCTYLVNSDHSMNRHCARPHTLHIWPSMWDSGNELGDAETPQKQPVYKDAFAKSDSTRSGMAVASIYTQVTLSMRVSTGKAFKMYVSVYSHDHHVSIAWLFRNCGRLGGVIVIACWAALAISEVFRAGMPAPDAYLQGGAIAIVFAGCLIGWRREMLGGALVILGTLAFYLTHAMTFADPPLPAAALLAAPGVFFLLARYLDSHHVGEVRQSHEH